MLSQKLRRDLILTLGVTLLYWLAAQLGFVFNDNEYLTPVWPPAAVACVAGILYGPRCLIGAAFYIAYDFVVYGSTHDWSHDRWAFIEPVSMLASAAVVSWTARRVAFTGRLDTVRAVMTMMAIGVLFAVVNGAGATGGYCGLANTRHCIASGWFGFWVQSMIGDVFGCLICMPALLSWARWIDARNNPGARNLAPPGFSERRRAPRAPGPVAMRADSRLPPVMRLSREQWLFILVSVAASALGWAITRDKVPVPVVGFLAMPLLVWAAIKFPPLFVHSAAMACGLITITLQLTAPGNISLDRATNTASLFLFLLSVSSLTLIVNVVVQQQRRLAGELAFRAQQERLELMLQAATDAVISFDEHGALSYWNPAAERLFGRKAAQALGRPVQEILPLPKLVAAATDGISALCDANDDLFSGAVIEFDAVDATGRLLPVELSLTAYRNDRGWTATAFMRDARTHKRQEEALRQARDKAEEATRAKSLFLATMSHELRTPLSGIIGMLQLGLREPMPAPSRSRVSLALGNAEALLAIINDILDFSKIEAGKLELRARADYAPRESGPRFADRAVGGTCCAQKEQLSSC